MIGHFSFILLYFIILSFVRVIYNKSINVSSEDDFKKAIESNYSNIVLNSSISVDGNYTLNSNIDEIKISGITRDIKLKFNNEINGLYIENYTNIEISNLSFTGNLFILKCSNTTIFDVDFNGLIQSSFSNITLQNFKYKNLQSRQSQYGISLDNVIMSISNSEFYGSSSIRDNIIYLVGGEVTEFINSQDLIDYSYTSQLFINQSFFSGEYKCSIIKTLSSCLWINESVLNNGFTNDNGAVINSELSGVLLFNSTLSNNHSYRSGGVCYLNNNYSNGVYYSDFYNSTAHKDGGILYISNIKQVHTLFQEVNVYDINQDTSVNSSGVIACIKGRAFLEVISLVVENYSCHNNGFCSLFTLSKNSRLIFIYGNINNVYINGEGGILVHMYDKEINNEFEIGTQEFKASFNEIYITNLVQQGPKSTSLFWVEDGHLRINRIHLTNFDGNKSGLIYSLNSELEISCSEFNEVHLETTDGLFYFFNGNGIGFHNIELTNLSFYGAIFNIKESKGLISVMNSHFENICTFQKSSINSCLSRKKTYETYENSVFLNYNYHYDKNFLVEFSYCTIGNIYGDTGIISSYSSYQIEFNYCKLLNNYFENSFLYFNNNNLYGEYGEFKQRNSFSIRHSLIEDNISKNSGGIFHLNSESLPNIAIKNCTFIENLSRNYGGVIYSENINNISSRVIFGDCSFYNNTAILGKISYSHSITSEPYFSNKDELIKMDVENAFVTNIQEIKLNDESDSIENIVINSGDYINKNIIFNLYDGYGNLINTGNEMNMLSIEDLIFFKLEINDTYNAEIIGQTENYCLGTDCILPNFKIVGNPGNYELKFLIQNFGHYSWFENNEYFIDLTIKECVYEMYLYQNRDSSYLKSCYIPVCEIPCNSGKCVNDNVCDCSDTKKTGKYCNEYLNLERSKSYDILIMIITSLLMLCSVILIIEVLIHKHDEVIRGGGKNFLIIILFGTILNYIYICLRTIKRYHITCLIIDITKRIGFSLVFGSILVKTLRIYYAIHSRIKKKVTIRTETMYFIIFLIMIFHLTLIMLFEVVYGHKVVPVYLEKSKIYEFYDCQKSRLAILSNIFNFMIMAICYYFTYSVRHLQSQYKESMTLTVYLYVAVEGILLIIDSQNMSLIIKDYFNTIGPLLYSVSAIYDIFYPKFKMIYKRIKNETYLMKDYENKKEYEYQRRFDDYSRAF